MSMEQNGLPPGWAVAPLKTLVQIGRGSTSPNSEPDRKFNYVALENVSKGSGSLVDFSPTKGSAIGSTKAVFREGDVLYGKLRPYLQKALVAPFDGVSVTDLIPLVPASGIMGRFIQHYLLGPHHLDYITPLLAGIRMPRLRKGDIEGMPVPLPGTNEQKRIVAKIEALQGRSEAAKEALDAIPPLLEKFRQSVLAAAFRGDLTKVWRAKNPDVEPATELLKRIRAERRRRWEEAKPGKKYKEPEPVDTTGLRELPEGWCWATFEEVLTYLTSGSRGWADFYSDSGSIFIRAQDINTDHLVLEDVAYVALPAKAEGTRTLVAPADLLVTITGANVTKAALVPSDIGEAYVSQHVALCRAVLPQTAPVLHRWLISEANGRKQLLSAAYGGGKPGLNLDNIRGVRVALPPLLEQVEIVGRLDEVFEECAALTEAARLATAVHSTLSQSILAKAFRGELVHQDPNDEPASVLLERIRAERNANGPSGSTKRGRRRSRRASTGEAT